jgi:hypothetical protein
MGTCLARASAAAARSSGKPVTCGNYEHALREELRAAPGQVPAASTLRSRRSPGCQRATHWPPSHGPSRRCRAPQQAHLSLPSVSLARCVPACGPASMASARPLPRGAHLPVPGCGKYCSWCASPPRPSRRPRRSAVTFPVFVPHAAGVGAVFTHMTYPPGIAISGTLCSGGGPGWHMVRRTGEARAPAGHRSGE